MRYLPLENGRGTPPIGWQFVFTSFRSSGLQLDSCRRPVMVGRTHVEPLRTGLQHLSQTGIGWPKFSTGDMVDLFAYLRALPEAASQSAIFQPEDPEQGRIT